MARPAGASKTQCGGQHLSAVKVLVDQLSAQVELTGLLLWDSAEALDFEEAMRVH